MSMKINTHAKSAELFQRAAKVIPSGLYGHQGPAEGCCIPVSAYPLFSQKAEGSYFWDVDGNRYIDYMCAYGPNVLGYNDPDVDKAVMEQMKIENCVTAPSTKIIEFAELMVDTVASADWAFFAKNGGDTTTAAIMTARAATHKKKIIFVKGYYHGVAPWCQKIDYPGVIPEDVANNLYVEWNNFEDLERIVAETKAKSPLSFQPLICTATSLITFSLLKVTGRRFASSAQKRASFLSLTTFVAVSDLTLQAPTISTALKLTSSASAKLLQTVGTFLLSAVRIGSRVQSAAFHIQAAIG